MANPQEETVEGGPRAPSGTREGDRIFRRYPGITMGVVAVLCVAFLSIVLEVSSALVIKARGGTVLPLLVWKADRKTGCDQSFLDPVLGYAHSRCDKLSTTQIPGFVVYPSLAGQSAKRKRIVALGGSTTDAILTIVRNEIGGESWPKDFRDICDQELGGCDVFNGGSGGFTSSQELLKLVRDVPPLRPDVVVSLNGINESYFMAESEMVRGHPYLSDYQRDLFLHLALWEGVVFRGPNGYQSARGFTLLPNFHTVVQVLRNKVVARKSATFSDETLWNIGLNFGTKSDLQPWEVWDRNARLMRAVGETLGFTYMVFLQPTLGVGDYEVVRNDERVKARDGEAYYEGINKLYFELRQRCKKLAFCVDLVDVFHGESDVYADPRHPNARGNRIQAKAIFEALASELREAALSAVQRKSISR